MYKCFLGWWIRRTLSLICSETFWVVGMTLSFDMSNCFFEPQVRPVLCTSSAFFGFKKKLSLTKVEVPFLCRPQNCLGPPIVPLLTLLRGRVPLLK